MRTKLVWLIIVVLLANTLIPNFIYAKEEKLEVNTEDFETIQKNYGESSWNKMIQDGKADITTENGTKTKKRIGMRTGRLDPQGGRAPRITHLPKHHLQIRQQRADGTPL